jgi:hypothetical protein
LYDAGEHEGFHRIDSQKFIATPMIVKTATAP